MADRNLAASVDFPMAFYWKDLMVAFPEAKVVLSTRSPESWRKSIMNSILPSVTVAKQFPMNLFFRLFGMTPRLNVSTHSDFKNFND